MFVQAAELRVLKAGMRCDFYRRSFGDMLLAEALVRTEAWSVVSFSEGVPDYLIDQSS